MALGLLLLAGGCGPTDQGQGKAKAESGAKDDAQTALVMEGEASYYADKFQGRKTANGEKFDQNKLTAATRELPLGTVATVTNPENGKSVEVVINDKTAADNPRLLDLSKKAARKLGMVHQGVADVRVELHPSKQPTPELRGEIAKRAAEAAETQEAKLE